MAYVKISDPKIIDLSTISQIVNVVNQHSDNITALTNNFGATYVDAAGNTSGATTQYQYDISSQQIFYGITTVNTTTATWSSSGYYTVSVTFAGQSFSTTPMVIASLGIGATSNPTMGNEIVSVSDVTTQSFKMYIRSTGYWNNNVWTKYNTSGWLSPNNNTYVNWIAIGPK